MISQADMALFITMRLIHIVRTYGYRCGLTDTVMSCLKPDHWIQCPIIGFDKPCSFIVKHPTVAMFWWASSMLSFTIDQQ
jgi:hypothetical protein